MGQLGDAMTEKEIGKIIDYLSIKGCFNNSFKGYAKMYAMTTENISGFLNKHDLKDKKVLTVAGSGDQRYNCYLRGAREVICFDNNPLAELNMRLKDTAMQELDYVDFLKFFGVILDNKSNYFLDPFIFNKFKRYLDKDVYLFYDFLINKFNRSPLGNAYEEFLFNYSTIREFDDYIVKSNFMELTDIMGDKSINFLNVNVANLPEILDGEKFDIILLSNISDYIHYVYPYPENHMKKYKELIEKLVDNLYDGGIIQLGYVYSIYDDCKRYDDYSKFHFDESRNKYFPFTKYFVENVHSYYGGRRYDKVITYQKKR